MFHNLTMTDCEFLLFSHSWLICVLGLQSDTHQLQLVTVSHIDVLFADVRRSLILIKCSQSLIMMWLIISSIPSHSNVFQMKIVLMKKPHRSITTLFNYTNVIKSWISCQNQYNSCMQWSLITIIGSLAGTSASSQYSVSRRILTMEAACMAVQNSSMTISLNATCSTCTHYWVADVQWIVRYLGLHDNIYCMQWTLKYIQLTESDLYRLTSTHSEPYIIIVTRRKTDFWMTIAYQSTQ